MGFDWKEEAEKKLRELESEIHIRVTDNSRGLEAWIINSDDGSYELDLAQWALQFAAKLKGETLSEDGAFNLIYPDDD